MAESNKNVFLYRDFLYRDVIECMTSGVAAFRAVRDPVSGEIVDFAWILQNAYAGKVTGRDESVLIGKRLLEELPEHGPTGLFERYRRVVETGEQDEFTTVYHDGQINGVFKVRAVKMGDGFAVAFSDITDEIERRGAYEAVAEHLAVATRAAGIGTWELDIDAGTVTWDDTSSRLFGRAPDETPSYEVWRSSIHPDDVDDVRRALFAARDAGAAGQPASLGVRFRVIHPDGSIRHVQSHGQLVASNNRRRLLGVNWDVTEETERREAFETLANRFRVATHSAGIGIWEHNLVTDERMWDEITYRILGRDPNEEASASNWRAAVHPEDIETVQRVIEGVRNSDPEGPGSSAGVRFRIIHPDGSIHHIQSHAQLVESERGRRLVGVNWEVTKEVESALELEVKRREAEAANIAKSQFLAVMSHEIRTPLNGVLGMAALLHQSELTERQKKMVKTIEESGDELLDILNGILDLSRIESGRIELEEAPFDLDELLRRAAALFGPQAREKGVEFRIEASAQAKGAFVGDGTRIRQVLYNLLSNAVKFTQKGEVTVSADVVRRSVKAGSSLELVLTVRDTGIGVPVDKLERIFQPFTQADGSTTRKFGGAGLGLTIASHLAELLGGSIVVQSEVGVGSTFTARLRVAAPPAAAVAPELEEPTAIENGPARPLRVLVAEDNATNQLVLQGLLAACGAEATVVDNGLKAIEAWAVQRFDLILLDIQMPVMDGVAAAREIRQMESQFGRARTPIVAASANAMTYQVESYLEAGMDGHLAKPIRPAAMIEALQRFAAPRAASGDDADAA